MSRASRRAEHPNHWPSQTLPAAGQDHWIESQLDAGHTLTLRLCHCEKHTEPEVVLIVKPEGQPELGRFHGEFFHEAIAAAMKGDEF